ncbi:MAG: sporulation protein YqfC [Clostridiales bacterium]|jgi:sporulation protein YqfC|nr:sporulation protein YqfC [Clostridiales bacterium]
MSIKKKLSNILELPKEIVLNLPIIIITGNDEISVENYKGIIEYSTEKIRLNSTVGILKIEGKKLILKQMTSECICITGLILKLEYVL